MTTFVIGFLFGVFALFAFLCVSGIITFEIGDDDDGDDDNGGDVYF